MEYPIRINKYIRDSGLASRREADKLVQDGKVLVNGQLAQMGMLVNKGDKVTIKKGGEKEYKYLAYYKPRGLATQSQKGSPSVIDEWRTKGLYPVGRLDKESEGLLILTNDGRLTTRLLEAPTQDEAPDRIIGKETFEKEYLVKTREKLKEGIVKIFQKGMDTEALGKLLPAAARIIDDRTLSVSLREGKRHQIRVMLAELGYTVSALKRIRIGPIRLGQLKPGETRELSQNEVGALFQ